MNEEQVAAARRFITAQFGEAFDDWWMSDDNTKSQRTGKPVTGWFVTVHDDVLSLDWADLTPDECSG